MAKDGQDNQVMYVLCDGCCFEYFIGYSLVALIETLVVRAANLGGFDVRKVYFADNIVSRCTVQVLFHPDLDMFESLYVEIMSSRQQTSL